MQLYINCGPEYIEEQREERLKAFIDALRIVPDLELSRCKKCSFTGIKNGIGQEAFNKLEDAKVDYHKAIIFQKPNLCDICNNIQATNKEIKDKRKYLNRYMTKLAKPVFICQVCRYSDRAVFNSKLDLKLHLQQQHDSYYIKKELE